MFSWMSSLVESNSRKYPTLCSFCLLWLTPVSSSRPEIRFFICTICRTSARYGDRPESRSMPYGTPAGNRSVGNRRSYRRQSDRFSSWLLRSQHQWMRHLHPCRVWKHMVIDPAGEDGRFHRHGPWLPQCLHPGIEIASCCTNLAFAVNLTACVLNAIADRFLVNVQADVVHIVGEPPWSYSESTFR